MKIGGKAYKALMRKIYFISIAIGVLGITGKLYLWDNPELQNETLNILVIVALVWGTFVYCIFQVLSLFEPIKEEYNWELVFPELALGRENDKFDLDNLEDLENPRERSKA